FSPVIKVVDVPGVVSVHPSFPATNFRDWVAHLRANPGKYSYGSSGSGSVQHMGMELLKLRTKTYIVHLPYRSVAPALTDLVAGRIPMVWDNLSSSLPLIKSGKVVPIGLAGGQRSPQLPTLQTFTELGLDNYSASTYFGVLAPGGTPPDVVRTLNDALNRVIQDPTINEQLVRAGGVPIGGSPEVLKHQIENELRKWAEVAAYAKVRVG
ncbi:MAG: tripartite tricarboxylate transporter substrate-binding protein, partial [Burkholderiaceae bacterium]